MSAQVSLLRLEEADCALLRSSNKLTFDLGTAERTNGAIPSADVDCWFAGDIEFILPADFERWFAEDDSAVELTPTVHVFLVVLNAVGSECCNRCSEPVACQPPREKSTAPYATHASIREYSFSEHSCTVPLDVSRTALIVYNYVCTELLSPSDMKTVGSCYVTFPYIEVFYMNIKG